MSTEENKALLRRAWDEIYGHGRLDFLEDFVLDDIVAHEPDADVCGIEEFRLYLVTYLAAFPDTSATIEDVVAEGDKVVSRYTVRGTHTDPLPLQGREAGGAVGPLRQPDGHAAAGTHSVGGPPAAPGAPARPTSPACGPGRVVRRRG